MTPAKNGDALVTPNQPWDENGSALVEPLAPLEYLARTLPLENRTTFSEIITRKKYTHGLVIINVNNRPTNTPETFPLIATAASAIAVDDSFFILYPKGFIIWFLSL